MKTSIVLLLSTIIAISPAISFAETLVPKPDLPANYEKWPESFQDSCKLDDKNIYTISNYGKIDPTTNTLDFVRVRKVNNTTLYIFHYKKRPSPDDTRYGYFRSSNQWIKLDLNTAEIFRVTTLLDKAVKKTLNKEWLEVRDACWQLEDASDKFLRALEIKFEK